MNEIMLNELPAKAQRVFPKGNKFIEPQKIIDTVSGYYHLPFDKAASKSRMAPIRHCRQVMMYLLSVHTKLTYQAIGEYFGDRDHTTVLHSYQAIKDLIETDDRVYYEINELTEKIFTVTVKVTSETDLVKVADEAIHLLLNLRHAQKEYNDKPGFQTRTNLRRWEDQSDTFLNKISESGVKPVEEIIDLENKFAEK